MARRCAPPYDDLHLPRLLNEGIWSLGLKGMGWIAGDAGNGEVPWEGDWGPRACITLYEKNILLYHIIAMSMCVTYIYIYIPLGIVIKNCCAQ